MYNQLMKVSKGFKLVYIGVLIVVLGMLGGILGMCIGGGMMGAGGVQGGAGLIGVVSVGMILCLLGGGITALIGMFLCLAVPEKARGAKPLIIVSVVLLLVGMGLGLTSNLAGLAGNRLGPAAGVGMSGASSLCLLASEILFLLFTRSCATYIRRHDLAETAMLVLWMIVITMVMQAVSVVIMLAAGVGGAAVGGGGGGLAAGACVTMAIGLVALVIGIIALIKFIGLMRDMSDATAEFAGSGNYSRGKKAKKRRREYDEDEDDYYERPRKKKRRSEDDEDAEEEEDEDEEDRRRERW